MLFISKLELKYQQLKLTKYYENNFGRFRDLNGPKYFYFYIHESEFSATLHFLFFFAGV